MGRGPLTESTRVPLEGRVRWDRVGRAALIALLSVVVLLYIAPLRNWMAQSQAAEAHRAQVRALARERDRLAARARDLARTEVIEQEARRLGMVRRGERPFVVESAPARR